MPSQHEDSYLGWNDPWYKPSPEPDSDRSELSLNIARIKASLDCIKTYWEGIRRYIPTNAEIEARAREDEQDVRWQYRNSEELERVLEEGFYAPEPPEFVTDRIAMDRVIAQEEGEYETS
jgi:hypothetical protein